MRLGSLFYGATLALCTCQTLAIAQGFPGPKVVDAKPGDVRVYVTATIRPPLEAVTTLAEKAIGKRIIFEYGSARGNLKDLIMAGNGDFEVAILLPDVNEALLTAGKIRPGTYELARVPIAFGLRGNASVDVSTPAAVKKTLLAANSINYSPTGAALFTVRKVLGDLQIADKVPPNRAGKPEVPLTGIQYEVNIFPLSEIISDKKLRNLGPVIKELQVPAVIEATIGTNAKDEATARALIDFLQGPAIGAALEEYGMEKGKPGASR